MSACHVAIDIGASSGRHIVGQVVDGRMELTEVYRFENGLVRRNGHLCWDIDALAENVIAGLAAAKEAWYDDRHDEDLVLYGPAGKCIEACIPARRKEGREPVVVTPDARPAKSYTEDMPYMDFMVRDALIDMRWGEELASVGQEGDVTVVRLKSGKAIRCSTFRDLRK